MRKSKFTESQIMAVLGEGEAGLAVAEVCRKHGISNATCYQWKSKYAGMSANELKRVKELEARTAVSNGCMRIWLWRMLRSRMSCRESCDADSQARSGGVHGV